MNSYSGKEPYVFLSYAHADIQKIKEIIVGLKRKMCRVWYDEGLTPGESWNDDIAEHIKKAECFVVFLTPSSVCSHYVKSEINYAISKNVKVIPVLLEKVDMPSGLELLLGGIQYADAVGKTVGGVVETVASHLTQSVFSVEVSPFYQTEEYKFFLEVKDTAFAKRIDDYFANNFVISAMDKNGNKKQLFLFEVGGMYEVDCSLTQCNGARDDYYVGKIDGVVFFNVLARCLLRYPFNGPDADVLLMFVLRIPQNLEPTVTLIDYKYLNIVASNGFEGDDLSKMAMGKTITDECERKLFAKN